MGVRNFRKNAKVITVIIALAFGLSSLALYITSHMNYSKTKNYALKVNGTQISLEEVARTKGLIASNINAEADDEILNTLALNQSIENELVQQLADDLKIKVPSSEVDSEYEKLEARFPDKEQFIRMLSARGYTRATFKKDLEKSIRSIKTREQYNEVSPEEVEAYYNENKGMYGDRTLEESREEIESLLVEINGAENFNAQLNQMKAEMELVDITEEFQNNLEIKTGNYTNIDYAKLYLNLLNTGLTSEEAKVETDKGMLEVDKLINKAKEMGITVNENKDLNTRSIEAHQGIYNKLYSEVVVNDKELNDYFVENRVKYDVPESVGAYLGILEIGPEELERQIAHDKAAEILKTVTPENFAETAKEKSGGPSGPNGGDLGWFGQDAMVDEFSKAAFAGEVGKVYPEVVLTQFGAHLIYIADKNQEENTVKASHILIPYEVTKETKAKVIKEEEETLNKLASNEIKYEELPTDRYKTVSFYEDIRRQEGEGEDLIAEIYSAKLNSPQITEIDGTVYLIGKTNQVKERKVSLEEVKENVEKDYKNDKTMKLIQEILN